MLMYFFHSIHSIKYPIGTTSPKPVGFKLYLDISSHQNNLLNLVNLLNYTIKLSARSTALLTLAVYVPLGWVQIQVRTRSVGTNTQEPGKAGDAAHMGPCQPGTSVNLEGIVWHETEEGEFAS